MTESGFEGRLALGLRDMADAGVRPFDPRAVSEAVLAAPAASVGSLRLLMSRESRRWIAVAAAAALLLVAALAALALLGSRPTTLERLAFVRNGDVWVASADGQDARLVAAHDPGIQSGGCVGAQWSADRSRLAALDLRYVGPTRRRISVLTADGATLGTFDVDAGPVSLAWSPEGNHLAVLAPKARVGGLWVLDGQARVERELPLPGGYATAGRTMTASWISWSPDGRLLAITGCPCNAENNGSWIVPVDGSAAREIRIPGMGNSMSLAWSPDGTRVAIGSAMWSALYETPNEPYEVWVAGVDGSTAKRVASSFGPVEVTGWSHDGTWIAYTEGLALDVVRADGSAEPVRLPFASVVARWSAQGRLFYLVGPPTAPGPPNGGPPSVEPATGSIMAVDPAGGDPVKVVDRVDPYVPFDLH